MTLVRNRYLFFVAGNHFSAGLDLADNSNLTDIAKTSQDVARRAFRFRKLALAMQVGYSTCPLHVYKVETSSN